MKTIKAFRDEAYGLFIDLEDAPASVGIDNEGAALLFNEGDGEGDKDVRFSGAAIAREAVVALTLTPAAEGRFDLVLQYRAKTGTIRSHLLGTTPSPDQARAWATRVCDRLGVPLQEEILAAGGAHR